MELPFIGGERLRAALDMANAVDALEHAFSGALPAAPDRSHLDVGDGDLLLMPAWSDGGVGVKLVTVAHDNPGAGLPLIQGLYALFEKPSLAPVALFDASALTALRTAAVSGVATRHLARGDSVSLVIFGAGVQGRAHLEAMAAVRPIERVIFVSRTPERARHLVDLATEMGLEADLGAAQSVAEADIICTCTTSSNPVFDGTALRAGTHINAVGSYKPSARELDDETIRRGRVVVDTLTAMSESGDLIIPLAEGVISESDIEDLSSVLIRGNRRSDADITVFKSVGAAFEDLVIAEAALKLL